MTRFEPTASWSTLRRRAELLKALRGFFDKHGFLEVETPLLSSDAIADRHIDPFRIESAAGADPNEPRWLQTSPEAAMKRLMAAGGRAIYQITRSFRLGEVGARHNPEFTIVEWYREGDGLAEGIARLDALTQYVAGAPPAVAVEYRTAFQQHLQIDPWRAGIDTLRRAAETRGLHLSNDHPPCRDDLLDFLLSAAVVPQFDGERPVILWGYPASQAALARIDPEEPRRAERFELFWRGFELANGYVELTDAAEWERRAAETNAQRAEEGRGELPVESRMLEAMRAGLPPCAGVALGFDRLVMADRRAERIEEVVAFPWHEA